MPQIVKAHRARYRFGPELHPTGRAGSKLTVLVLLDVGSTLRLAAPADVVVAHDQARTSHCVAKHLLRVSGR